MAFKHRYIGSYSLNGISLFAISAILLLPEELVMNYYFTSVYKVGATDPEFPLASHRKYTYENKSLRRWDYCLSQREILVESQIIIWAMLMHSKLSRTFKFYYDSEHRRSSSSIQTYKNTVPRVIAYTEENGKVKGFARCVKGETERRKKLQHVRNNICSIRDSLLSLALSFFRVLV